MRLSQSQIEACKQIEASGGPQTEAETRLYTQYLRAKERHAHAKKQPLIHIDSELARAAHGMKQLETELIDLEKELDGRQQRLDELLRKSSLD